jgi:hypothetical protein
VQVVRRVCGTWRGHRLILFGFLPQSSKTKAVAAVVSVSHARTVDSEDTPARRGDLARFREEFYGALTARADALFELTDAILCADGPVRSLAELTLVAEHRRGHGAMYDALGHGRVEPERIRRSLAALPLPRMSDGRIVLAVDVSPWLRSDAPTSPERLFCHVHGRGRGQAQMIPGWPYSFVAALEPGRTSWTALLDAVRLGPADDTTAATAGQLRAVITRLVAAGHWRPGDPRILVVADAGYDITRLAFVLADLPPPHPTGGPGHRTPAAARPGVHPVCTRHVVGPDPHHQNRHQPIRPRGRDQLGRALPTPDPPRRVGRPSQRAAHHHRHPDPPAGRAPPGRPRPETDLAVVLDHRRDRRRCDPVVAVVPATIRS